MDAICERVAREMNPAPWAVENTARLPDEALNGVVEDCVNAVGVDVNVASAPLLERVAGITPALAGSIVAWRDANGPFPDRKTLLQVPKLGPARYRQCAGFLRVPESADVLDHTAVHPESYDAAKKLLQLCGYGLQDVGHLDRLPARGPGKEAHPAFHETGWNAVRVPFLHAVCLPFTLRSVFYSSFGYGSPRRKAVRLSIPQQAILFTASVV